MVDKLTVAQIMADSIVDVANNHGVWITIFAVIGVISVFNAAIKKATPLFSMIGLGLIVTPLIIIRSACDKNARYGIKDDLKQIVDFLKVHPMAAVWAIVYVVVLLSIIIAIVYYEVVAMAPMLNESINTSVCVANETILNDSINSTINSTLEFPL
jgi:hypothetical protein